MADPEPARREPLGTVELVWDPADPYVVNRRFDARLIAHDDSYCTTLVDLDEVQQLPTASYFASRVQPHLPQDARVVDIGCGRGEFVEHLRSVGVDAVGYDPVLGGARPHLRNRYWTPQEETADLFVMRCVLPHIPDPWHFVRELGRANPGALLLVEFQRREWILQAGIWYQMSHDHVNVFSVDDFAGRLDVVDDGTFSHGEWAWVLFRAASYATPPATACGVVDDFARLTAQREGELAGAAASDRPLCLWGAAGKGIVLAHALVAAGAPLVAAIDADPLRQGRFMEVSGVEIMSPAQARDRLPRDAVVVVCNPNHLADITARGLVANDVVLSRQLAREQIVLGAHVEVDLRRGAFVTDTSTA